MNHKKGQWSRDLNNQSKLRTYKYYKAEFRVEKYVKADLPSRLRSIVAQIGSGTLPLRIKTGITKM